MEIGMTMKRMEKVYHCLKSIGVLYYDNGDKYTGELKNDQINGEGNSYLKLN